MRCFASSRFLWFPLAALVISVLAAAEDPRTWDRSQQEEFLRTAKVIKTNRAPGGITGSKKLTLSKDGVTHDAHFQTIDERKPSFQSAQGAELNFRDSYRYNIAGYRLDRMLGLDMVPTSIERRLPHGRGALTWWVDDVAMVEKERYQKKIDPPNKDLWNRQMRRVRLFNQLIYNTDPNLGNFLIDKNWKLWAVDFSRGFRTFRRLRDTKNLESIDRRCIASLKALTLEGLTAELQDILSKTEIRALLARRDRIIEFFDEKAAALGEDKVFYDWDSPTP